MLVEFASAEKLEFRIGIHIGDIIFEGNDIFGNGVNVAARFENEREPGGIYLSDDAFRRVAFGSNSESRRHRRKN
jgi:class 3 adenylate cyclase